MRLPIFNTVTIAGGASGIGEAICHTFAKNGARVIVADLEKSKADGTMQKLEGSNHSSIGIDVSKPESGEKLRDFLRSNNLTPSVLVNCAGITKDATLLKMPIQSWKDVIDVNLSGTFYISQIVAREAVEQKSKLSIINVSSIVGKIGSFGTSNYAATKAGVIGLTKTAARELAKKNIRVNAILPGYVETNMTGAMPPEVLADLVKLIPQGRMAKPKEIANAVLFLASDLSSYVTGTTLEVTGGYGM